ncbi:mitochondrial carrier domain-containing protein [Endogone sp. FLAS-F59071]|nr:mitochondrial carrier domain-containing protein [Endogone sp. FLAS-F59071]|eukprot:RUS20044.1 mitochondrial carrier domain-containing protein [Endogone sp. FLAS-F59071]
MPCVGDDISPLATAALPVTKKSTSSLNNDNRNRNSPLVLLQGKSEAGPLCRRPCRNCGRYRSIPPGHPQDKATVANRLCRVRWLQGHLFRPAIGRHWERPEWCIYICLILMDPYFSCIVVIFIASCTHPPLAASLFFVTYEFSKRILGASISNSKYDPLVHMASASFGEISACVVRVPTEIIKQRMQTKQFFTTSSAVSAVIKGEGILGFYRGYLSTVAREIPFTCIQFPLYEYLKRRYALFKGRRIEPYEAAMCGSVAGGFAAALTTPLDVCKTRIMLSSKHQTIKPYTDTVTTIRRILAEEGSHALFAGIGPRVLWISIGGSIFLGVYEKAVKTMIETGLLADRW